MRDGQTRGHLSRRGFLAATTVTGLSLAACAPGSGTVVPNGAIE